MTERAFIFVPGVRTDVEDRSNWCHRADRWVRDNGLGHAEVYWYETKATLRWAEQGRHAKGLSDLIWSYISDPHDPVPVTLVGHSNGCELILRAMREWPELRARSIHLIAAAADADCRRNGINGLKSAGLYLYGSPDDGALKLGRLTSWLRIFGCGYGDLGRAGPQRNAYTIPCDWRPGYGHSTWFDPDRFDETMRLVTR